MNLNRKRPTVYGDKYYHFGFGSRRAKPKRQREFHRHNEIEFLYLEKGGIDYLIGGKKLLLRPGRLTVFWGAIPHAPISIKSDTVVNRLTIPLPWFLLWQLPQASTQAFLAGAIVAESNEQNSSSDKSAFWRWHSDLEDGSENRRKLVLLESEARLRRLLLATSLPLKQTGRSKTTNVNSSKVESMSQYITLHYSEPLSVVDIAKHVRLHPDYAGKLFRNTCGVGLLEFVNEYRVAHAQRVLATSDAKIIDVALMSGFGSASRFYSAFKKACAQTPREYRDSMGIPGSMPAI